MLCIYYISLTPCTLYRERLETVPKDATEFTFGNSVYQVRFEERTKRSLYGDRYWFYLKDAVEDVPEYVVHWENFVQYVHSSNRNVAVQIIEY